MNAIWLVAANTFRQTVRQRVFYNVAIFGVGMVLLAMVIGNITYGYPDRVVRSIGLGGVTLALDMLALLVGVTLIHQEVDRKTLFVVLVRPVRRWQYVAGRYLGLVFTLAVTQIGLSIAFFAVLLTVSGHPQLVDAAALGAALPEAAIIGGVGIALSAFSTPLLSAGLGIGFWLIAASTDDFLKLAAKAHDPAAEGMAKAFYYVFPSLARFNFRDLAIYQGLPTLAEYASAFGYGLMYAIVLCAIASAILSRREML